MDNVDIASPEFKYLLKQAVLETLKEMIAESPQHTEISMLLLIHVRDMQTFKDKIESELQSIKQHLSRIDGRLDGIDGRLDSSENRLQKIEETMVTKDYREETLKTFMTREETLKTFMTKAELRSEFKDMVAQIGRTMRQMLDERDDRDKVKGQELFESKS